VTSASASNNAHNRAKATNFFTVRQYTSTRSRTAEKGLPISRIVIPRGEDWGWRFVAMMASAKVFSAVEQRLRSLAGLAK
jgi:hypothetical protein